MFGALFQGNITTICDMPILTTGQGKLGILLDFRTMKQYNIFLLSLLFNEKIIYKNIYLELYSRELSSSQVHICHYCHSLIMIHLIYMELSS